MGTMATWSGSPLSCPRTSFSAPFIGGLVSVVSSLASEGPNFNEFLIKLCLSEVGFTMLMLMLLVVGCVWSIFILTLPRHTTTRSISSSSCQPCLLPRLGLVV